MPKEVFDSHMCKHTCKRTLTCRHDKYTYTFCTHTYAHTHPTIVCAYIQSHTPSTHTNKNSWCKLKYMCTITSDILAVIYNKLTYIHVHKTRRLCKIDKKHNPPTCRCTAIRRHKYKCAIIYALYLIIFMHAKAITYIKDLHGKIYYG